MHRRHAVHQHRTTRIFQAQSRFESQRIEAMLATAGQSIHSSVYPWSFGNLWAICALAHALSDDCISGPSQNLRVKNSHFVFNSHARTWGLTYIPARTSLSKPIWQSRPWSNYFENRAVFTVNICLICKCSSHTVINDVYYPALIKSASAELSTVTPLNYFENISVFTVNFCLICKCSCHTVINDVYYHAFKSDLSPDVHTGISVLLLFWMYQWALPLRIYSIYCQSQMSLIKRHVYHNTHHRWILPSPTRSKWSSFNMHRPPATQYTYLLKYNMYYQ